MRKIYVVYWTQTGNTLAMANAIAEGIKEGGCEAELLDVSEAAVELLKDEKVFALGCPAMGAEVLEEGEMEPFMEEIEAIAGGKQIALFGSYGWGDGQWMRDWEERVEGCGAKVLGGEGLICREAPDETTLSLCKTLGKSMASV